MDKPSITSQLSLRIVSVPFRRWYSLTHRLGAFILVPSSTPSTILSETDTPAVTLQSRESTQLIILTSSDCSFLIDLTITQAIDATAKVLSADLGGTPEFIIMAIAIVLDFGAAGQFVLLGWLGKKRYAWPLLSARSCMALMD